MYTKYGIGFDWYIVLIDDVPVVTPEGATMVFYREVDADRFIRQKTEVVETLNETISRTRSVALLDFAKLTEQGLLVSDNKPKRWKDRGNR